MNAGMHAVRCCLVLNEKRWNGKRGREAGVRWKTIEFRKEALRGLRKRALQPRLRAPSESAVWRVATPADRPEM